MKDLDQERLENVRQFGQLDFNKNIELNDIVTLASEICKVPIAMITLMDDNVQLIKCKIGVDIDSNSRENSFCKYLMNQDEVMVVPDALLDPRFINNPAVKGEYAIRFYAGAPLITNTGFHLGSLCVFDQKPHSFTDKQKAMLAILSKQAVHLMELEMSLKLISQRNAELKKQREKIDASESKLRAFFNSSAFCHILISKNLEVIDFNKATAVFIKEMYNKQISTGKSIMEYISPAYKNNFVSCLNRAFRGRRSNKEVLIKYEGKAPIWWNISFGPV
jgi:hypothetical protein